MFIVRISRQHLYVSRTQRQLFSFCKIKLSSKALQFIGRKKLLKEPFKATAHFLKLFNDRFDPFNTNKSKLAYGLYKLEQDRILSEMDEFICLVRVIGHRNEIPFQSVGDMQMTTHHRLISSTESVGIYWKSMPHLYLQETATPSVNNFTGSFENNDCAIANMLKSISVSDIINEDHNTSYAVFQDCDNAIPVEGLRPLFHLKKLLRMTGYRLLPEEDLRTKRTVTQNITVSRTRIAKRHNKFGNRSTEQKIKLHSQHSHLPLRKNTYLHSHKKFDRSSCVSGDQIGRMRPPQSAYVCGRTGSHDRTKFRYKCMERQPWSLTTLCKVVLEYWSVCLRAGVSQPFLSGDTSHNGRADEDNNLTPAIIRIVRYASESENDNTANNSSYDPDFDVCGEDSSSSSESGEPPAKNPCDGMRSNVPSCQPIEFTFHSSHHNCDLPAPRTYP
ncbi:hypothetical protein PR048_020845 [Dryococelus australis]|uniref:Uncharacterized protein n=1 Tax=Dryococelus australis TaxID=614101 RepID=A0ABQ9GWJ7_9NEOP|nr:hypothetical protein PR048_020845 [Dryococelus australis]